eukprot:Skav212278  [mRNA]  locus=scaffold732:289773:292746:- [translate_table: standard]
MPRNINSKGVSYGVSRRKAEREIQRREERDEHLRDGGSSSGEEFEGRATKLVLFEFGQNDPKMDSGVRLCSCLALSGLVWLVSIGTRGWGRPWSEGDGEKGY